MWQSAHSIETSAAPHTVWALFSDVAGWKQWNAGIDTIVIHGPFANGTEFQMRPPGQDMLTSRLVNVVENQVFEDETLCGDVRVLVAHRIEPLASGRSRITYAATVYGPDADQVGAAVTGDFPQVLQALVALAERTALRA